MLIERVNAGVANDPYHESDHERDLAPLCVHGDRGRDRRRCDIANNLKPPKKFDPGSATAFRLASRMKSRLL